MRKLISILLICPLFTLSQTFIDVGLDNNDSLRKVTIIPFLSSHFSVNQFEEDNIELRKYGTIHFSIFSF